MLLDWKRFSQDSENRKKAAMRVKSKEVVQIRPTKVQRWWEKESIKYAFSHPHVRSRLEKLMGSNVVCLTDREYMQKLQQRILQDYAHKMGKRIAVRQADEMERVKNLVLIGKIPLSEAPPEMANHPVMLIEMYCNKLIAERRAKIKVQKIYIPNYLYWDDTPDPPSGLCIEKGHIFKSSENKLCLTAERFLPPPRADDEEEEVEEEEEEELDPYMFTQEEFERIKYESPLIKELRACETVEEMYALADEIIGVLKTIAEKKEEVIEEEPIRVHSTTHERELSPEERLGSEQQLAPEPRPTMEPRLTHEEEATSEQQPTMAQRLAREEEATAEQRPAHEEQPASEQPPAQEEQPAPEQQPALEQEPTPEDQQPAPE